MSKKLASFNPILVSAAAMCGWSFAFSINSAAADPSAADAGLDEIVVTAQRRSENLETTPVSVSVLGNEQLQKQAIKTDSDIQIAVPGLLVRTGNISNQLNFALRGQSLDGFTGSQPSVLPYFDEIPVYAQGSSGYYDLDSIQVLKGPQGTLFGRNSTGGAVLLTSAQPSNDFGGYVSVRGGNYDYGSVEGAINLPIVPDKVLLRLSGDYETRAGFVRNIYDGTNAGSVDRRQTRISLTLAPVEGFKNVTVFDFSHSSGSNIPQVLYSVYPLGSMNNGYTLNTYAALFASPNLDLVAGPGAWAAYLAAHPKANPLGVFNVLAQQKANGPYVVDSAGPFSHNQQVSLVSNISTYDVNSDTQIKNIFGFLNSFSHDLLNSGSLPYILDADSGVTDGGTRGGNKNYSEEIQILGKALGERLNYVAGFFYAHDYTLIYNQYTFADFLPKFPPTIATLSADQYSTSYAAYAQGTYDLGQLTGIEGLGFTGGVRYTTEDYSETVNPDSSFYQAIGVVPGFQRELSSGTSKVSWQVGAQEQLNKNLLLYIVSRHSFRSGGFNGDFSPINELGSQGGARFNPETTTDVEAGAKFEGTVVSLPFRLNAAIYNQWVDNAQRAAYSISGVATVNVPQALIRGIEIDGQVKPAKWLSVGASTAYANARFTEGNTSFMGTPVSFGPYSDTPKWTGTLFAEVSQPLPQDVGTLSFRADAFAQSPTELSPLGATLVPDAVIPGYTLLNFRVGVDNIEGSHLSVAAYIKNALDREYYTGGAAYGAALGENSVIPGTPRMYYGEATYRF